jgi:hypothetical protein
MVPVFFDMHDERHAAFVFARQALDTTAVGIEHGVQLAQVPPRQADINAVAYNGDKHVFPTSLCIAASSERCDDYRQNSQDRSCRGERKREQDLDRRHNHFCPPARVEATPIPLTPLRDFLVRQEVADQVIVGTLSCARLSAFISSPR